MRVVSPNQSDLNRIVLYKQIEQLKQKADKRVRSVSTYHILVLISHLCVVDLHINTQEHVLMQ